MRVRGVLEDIIMLGQSTTVARPLSFYEVSGLVHFEQEAEGLLRI